MKASKGKANPAQVQDILRQSWLSFCLLAVSRTAAHKMPAAFPTAFSLRLVGASLVPVPARHA